MRTRTRLLLLVAAPLVAVDLLQKASEPVYGHPRGAGFDVLALGLALAVVVLVPRVPSRALSIAGGVACAGASGNLLSALAWRGGIPNPIVLGHVAFNIADLCAAGGAVALVVGAALVALRNPALLRQPI